MLFSLSISYSAKINFGYKSFPFYSIYWCLVFSSFLVPSNHVRRCSLRTVALKYNPLGLASFTNFNSLSCFLFSLFFFQERPSQSTHSRNHLLSDRHRRTKKQIHLWLANFLLLAALSIPEKLLSSFIVTDAYTTDAASILARFSLWRDIAGNTDAESHSAVKDFP